MNKNKEIGEQGRLEGYLIRTNSGLIFIDKDGQWWLGGTPSRMGVAIYRDRWQAIKMAKKVKHQRPDLIKWTQTVRVYDVKY